MLAVAAQGSEMGLSGWQVVGVFVGVPAIVFAVIALLVVRLAPRRAGAFPVLRAPSSTASAAADPAAVDDGTVGRAEAASLPAEAERPEPGPAT